MSYIGVDLHTTQVTVCYLKEDEKFQITRYEFDKLAKFVEQLESADEIAVEATGNTRWFCEQVADKVSG